MYRICVLTDCKCGWFCIAKEQQIDAIQGGRMQVNERNDIAPDDVAPRETQPRRMLD